MIRLTRRVFDDLALWMVGFGILIGLLFPLFALMLGLPRNGVLTPGFFAACVFAGIIVGATNIGLARSVVGGRLRVLAQRMQQVEDNLLHMIHDRAARECSPEDCFVGIDSDDDFGSSARSFNRLVRTLDASLRNARAVREFNELLTGELELDLLAQKALMRLLEHTRSSAGAVLLNDEGETRLCVAFGLAEPAATVKSELLQQVLGSQRRQRVLVPEDVMLDGVLTSFRPREVLVEPVVFANAPVCAVLLASATGFSDDDLLQLDLLHRGLALSFHNAMLYERLERLAALDAQTGLYNRRFGMTRLQEEFGRSLRTGAPLGLVMFDIDHFKKVNDAHGHLVGDRVIKQIAHLARSVARQDDVIMRYGGEEFLMVLPGATPEDAEGVAERVRRSVEASHVSAGALAVHVTVSVGATSFPSCNAKDELDCLRMVDEALYAAKDADRNRVVIQPRAEATPVAPA